MVCVVLSQTTHAGAWSRPNQIQQYKGQRGSLCADQWSRVCCTDQWSRVCCLWRLIVSGFVLLHSRNADDEQLQAAMALSLRESSSAKEEKPPAAPTVVQQTPLHQDSFPALDSGASSQKKSLPKTAPVWSQTQKANGDQFPALSSTSAAPSRAASAPPGFAAAVTCKPNHGPAVNPASASQTGKPPSRPASTRPPPGFTTANTASGSNERQTQSAATSNGASVTGQSRAEDFINFVKLCLSFNTEKFQLFRLLSGNFRQGQLTADDYFAAISDLFGANLQKVFAELVDTLPEQHLQEQLLCARNDARVQKASAGTKTKTKTDAWPQLGNCSSISPALPSQWAQKPAKEKPPPAQVQAAPKTMKSVDDFPALSVHSPAQPLLVGSWARRKG